MGSLLSAPNHCKSAEKKKQNKTVQKQAPKLESLLEHLKILAELIVNLRSVCSTSAAQGGQSYQATACERRLLGVHCNHDDIRIRIHIPICISIPFI